MSVLDDTLAKSRADIREEIETLDRAIVCLRAGARRMEPWTDDRDLLLLGRAQRRLMTMIAEKE